MHARGQRGGVAGGHRPGEHDKVSHPRVGHPVPDEPAGPAGLHVAAGRQARQVSRNPALGQADVRHALGHRVLAGQQELQQAQPGRVSERAEEPGHHLNPVIRRGQQHGIRGCRDRRGRGR
jgi:hypothetical protein